MCSFDQTLALAIPLWLQDFGMIKDLGQIVASYVPKCPERMRVSNWRGSRFESECACTAATRDRRFVMHQMDLLNGTEERSATLDAKLRPTSLRVKGETARFRQLPGLEGHLQIRRFGITADHSLLVEVPLLTLYRTSVELWLPKHKCEELKQIVKTSTEDLGIDELINGILETRQ